MHQTLTGTASPSRLALFVLALCLLACGALPAQAAQGKLGVASAIVMDMGTGKILYEQNADEPIAPASLTKVMSMYLAFDRIDAGKASLKDAVKVSKRAQYAGGSRMFVKAGENVTVAELLKGMAVASGNDATTALAEYMGGGDVRAFVDEMNAKARKLGMTRTHFANPHGLPNDTQITTARDMLTLGRNYLRAHPESLAYHSARTLTHNKVISRNRNPLLDHCDGADGLKTGWVCASGYNIIATAKRGNTRLLAVVMGARTSSLRAREVRRLMEAGFSSASDDAITVAEVLAQGKTPEVCVVAPQKKDKSARLAKAKTSKQKTVKLAKGSSKKSRSKAVVAAKASGKKSRKATVAKAASPVKATKAVSSAPILKKKAKSEASAVKKKAKTASRAKSKSDSRYQADAQPGSKGKAAKDVL